MMGFAGLLLLLWEVYLFRLTFIPLRVLLGVMLLATAVATLLDIYSFKATYHLRGGIGLLMAALWNLVSWGFICSSLFLISNYYLTDGGVSRKEFAIVERSSHPGSKGAREKRKPTFTIRYKGLQRELVFAHRFYKWKDDYRSVILTLQEGRWGYEVIKGKAVTK